MARAFLIALAGLLLLDGEGPVTPASATGCPERPPCKGCGCKGGPGYRARDTDRCVGFRELDKICGTPPGTNCDFENAPGTGANRECALVPRKRTRSAL